MRLIPVLLLAAFALTACAKKVEAPYDTGVCWHAQPMTDGTVRFNKLAVNQPNIETCAASLEAMRMKFLSLGGGHDEIMGAYQGNFIFLLREGIFTSQTLDGTRYLALVPTGDGRLVPPGSMPREP